jgi:hypothetical protein
MDLASILTAHWGRFAATHRHILTAAHYKAARAVMACRTAALGGQVHQCGECVDERRYVYHSCNHRACPKCGGRGQKEWAAAQEAKLLARVPYFMLTFTIPEELRAFAYQEQRWFYDAMFKAAAGTLMDFSLDEKHLGGTPGFTSVLHTWTRQMQHHPHLHVIIPGIALSADGLRVHRAKGRKYLFPIKALAAAFRHRLDKAILARDTAGHTRQHTQIDPQVWRMDWIIDARAVGRGVTALRYLARYVKKTAISGQRLLGHDAQGNVRLNCQDSTTGKWRVIHLTPDEFLRRWCLHVLPKGLVRVRHHGLHSAAAKNKWQRLHHILGTRPVPKPAPLVPPKPKCPCCGGDMILLRVIPPLPRAWLTLPARAPPPAASSA